MSSLIRAALAIAIDGDNPPTEFRLFRAGPNKTTKGVFIYDRAAEASVKKHAAEYGNEYSIDYNHGAVEERPIDPERSGRAAGWFNLGFRDGELWAVNVRWTPAALTALGAKEWRYTSPAFNHAVLKDGSKRVAEIVNCALTNTPATHQLTPLVAASITGLNTVDPALISKALDALVAGDSEACAQILKDLIASAAGAEIEEPADASAEPPPEGDPAMADSMPAAMAATSRLLRLTKATSLSAALDAVELYQASHIALSVEKAKLEKERVALEASERDQLGVALVTKCGRNPSAVWADPLVATDPKRRTLRKALASMSLADLREEVRLSARGTSETEITLRTPTDENCGLTPQQLQICKEHNIAPAAYAAAVTKLGMKY